MVQRVDLLPVVLTQVLVVLTMVVRLQNSLTVASWEDRSTVLVVLVLIFPAPKVPVVLVAIVLNYFKRNVNHSMASMRVVDQIATRLLVHHRTSQLVHAA
jgi:hypothetical protein